MRAANQDGRLIAGRYRLLDPIGRGSMGVVWRGRDELLHRYVAVKEVMITAGQAPGDSRLTIGEASYQRTLREARAAARLSHPGVITVFDIVDEDASPWIVMELIRGRSLDQVIAEDGPLPPRHAAQLGVSLLSALAAAHAAGVLHRDVKPANVLVAADGRVVLTDFGIAKIGADAGMTRSGMVVGTPGYTPPERIRGEPATPASDLWSLGATLYAAVEGRGPFDRPGGVAAICAGIVGEEPPRAPSAGSLAPVIAVLLRREAGGRPDAATTAALLADAAGADPAAGLLGTRAAYPAGPAAAVAGSGGSPAAHPAYLAAYGARAARPGPAGARPADARPGYAAAYLAPAAYLPAAARQDGPAAGQDGPAAGQPATGSRAAAEGPAGAPGDPAQAGTVSLPAAGQPAGGPGRPGFLDPPDFDRLAMPSRYGAPGQPGAPYLPGAAGVSEPALPAFLDPVTGNLLTGAPPGAPPPGGIPLGEGPPGAGPRGTDPGRAGPGHGDSGTGGPGTGGPGTGGPADGRPGTGAPGSQPGSWPVQPLAVPAPPPRPRRRPGYWRLVAAGAGIAAIVIAALVGVKLYERTLTTANPAGAASAAAGSDARAGAGGTGAAGTPAARAPARSTAAGTTADGGPLPAGYAWHTVTAASLGTTAGFVMAVPERWQVQVQGQDAYLVPPGGDGGIKVSAAPQAAAQPMAAARQEQAAAIASQQYPGYRLTAIVPATFRGSTAAAWRFTWRLGAAARTSVLTVLVTLPTSAGAQPYALSVSAPARYFPAARKVFGTALATFRPLPG